MDFLHRGGLVDPSHVASLETKLNLRAKGRSCWRIRLPVNVSYEDALRLCWRSITGNNVISSTTDRDQKEPLSPFLARVRGRAN